MSEVLYWAMTNICYENLFTINTISHFEHVFHHISIGATAIATATATVVTAAVQTLTQNGKTPLQC